MRSECYVFGLLKKGVVLKKSIVVEFRSIRNVNDFCSLNRLYAQKVKISSDNYKSNDDVCASSNVHGSVEVTAEGSTDAVTGLFESYRLVGIA